MEIKRLHTWRVSYRKAVAIQKRLRSRLRFLPLKKKIGWVAGADVSYSKYSPKIFAAVVVMKLPDMTVIEVAGVEDTATFPYIPGLLSFREIPVLCEAFRKLRHIPDAVICDGQGIAHPRRIGLAAHLGLILDLPTVGCAKSLFVGTHRPVPPKQWSRRPLMLDGERVGTVIRTRDGVKPVYVSPGHKIDFSGSVRLIRECVTRYRLPEPTRLAHIAVNQLRMGLLDKRCLRG